MVKFGCGNCGQELDTLEMFIEHIKAHEWYCWHKESGGYVTVELEAHNCGRDYCIQDQASKGLR